MLDKPMKILVVEDEAAISSVIERGLREAGYEVAVCDNGLDGLEAAEGRTAGLMILDLMLPKMDGWQVCERIRADRNPMPILMLTALDALDERVKGLDCGADDYLTKPFAFPELLARVRALLRRDKLHKSRVICAADLEIDTGARTVTRSGKDIRLTPREFDLLEALAANEGRVLTREVIQDRVWMADDRYSNTVDAFIRLLRRKVDAEFDLKLIHTIHGVGYSLRADGGADI